MQSVLYLASFNYFTGAGQSIVPRRPAEHSIVPRRPAERSIVPRRPAERSIVPKDQRNNQ